MAGEMVIKNLDTINYVQILNCIQVLGKKF
jgi:hypothetical protein